MVQYEILGPLTARVHDQPVALGGARTRAVLAVLLLDRNAVISVDRLVDLVWGEDPPPTVETALQGHISRLRRVLGAEAIETQPPGYVLRVEPGAVDVERFESLVRRASVAPPRDAGELLREALGLWQGPALADLEFQPFAEVEIARLDELRLSALEARVDADLASGRHDALAGELEALVSEHPYRERLHGQRILALYRSGRQAEALAAYQTARTALDEGLGIDPGPELQAIEVRILQQDPTLAAPALDAAAPPTNIPLPSTPLIGRQTELADLWALIHGSTRLITLTGPGGTGKTRLALELARTLEGEDPAGSWFVDLSSSTEVWQAIASIQGALGVADAAGDDPLEALREFLRPRRLLLVLDNLEQILEIATPIATLLGAAPGLRLVATSRAPLRIGGEREYPLAPLASGIAGQAIDLDAPPDAVALFVARARVGVPGFGLTRASADTVAELCRRLDGLPLAIELAASRVRLLSPTAILERLAAGLDILHAERRDLSPRQRTLEATIDWSYRLLDHSAQRAFRRCATFAGGFNLAAFEAVCVESDDDPLEVLGMLVESSLVERRRPGEADEPRFGMLETIRQFASDLLRSSGKSAQAQNRHAEYFFKLFTSANTIANPTSVVIELDTANLGATLTCLGDENPMAAFELYAATYRRLHMTGHLRESEAWCAQLRPRVIGAEAQAQLDAFAGAIAHNFGAPEKALDLLVPALDTLLQLGVDTYATVLGCSYAAAILIDSGDLDRATFFSNSGLEVATRIGDDRLLGLATDTAAYVARAAGAVERSVELARMVVTLARRSGDRAGLVYALSELSRALINAAEPNEALEFAVEGLEIANSLGKFTLGVANASQAVGQSLVALGRSKEAVEPLRQVFMFDHSSGSLPTSLGWLAVAVAATNPDLGARLLGAAEALVKRTHDPEILPPAALLDEVRMDLELRNGDAIREGHTLGSVAIADLVASLETDIRKLPIPA
jgi:predicted ATPase/DNA-binding SARP family transcriptional activator